jgi:hypothetical protein
MGRKDLGQFAQTVLLRTTIGQANLGNRKHTFSIAINQVRTTRNGERAENMERFRMNVADWQSELRAEAADVDFARKSDSPGF